MKTPIPAAWLAVLLPLLLAAANESTEAAKDGIYFEQASTQSEADEYTAYQLLAPETASFRISYEVSATTPGAKAYYNPIRKGSVASDESVYDASSGAPLHFQIVPGSEARKDPLMSDADAQTDYIKVSLARPVPLHGGVACGLVLHLQRRSGNGDAAARPAYSARLLERSPGAGGCAAEGAAAGRGKTLTASPTDDRLTLPI